MAYLLKKLDFERRFFCEAFFIFLTLVNDSGTGRGKRLGRGKEGEVWHISLVRQWNDSFKCKNKWFYEVNNLLHCNEMAFCLSNWNSFAEKRQFYWKQLYLAHILNFFATFCVYNIFFRNLLCILDDFIINYTLWDFCFFSWFFLSSPFDGNPTSVNRKIISTLRISYL